MNTQENNQLIAEFMGMTYGDPNDNSVMMQMTPKGNEVVPIELMEYHTSWDWLMPVVVECFDRQEEVSDDLSFKLNDTLLETNIESLYKIVVEFINQLNKYEYTTRKSTGLT